MEKNKKLKPKMTEITAICSYCGKSFETLLPDNLDPEDFTIWACRKCGTELGEYLDHVEEHEKEAKHLGYFYCWRCKKKVVFKRNIFPYCSTCGKIVVKDSDEEEDEVNSLR